MIIVKIAVFFDVMVRIEVYGTGTAVFVLTLTTIIPHRKYS